MDHACQIFRTGWLERALEAGARPERGHLDACGECRAWMGGAQAQIAAFGLLARLAAPKELEARLFETTRASDAAVEELWTRRLGDLKPLAAPAVLERLVDEELRSPLAARARRFAGDLERQETPPALERRISTDFARPVAPRRLSLRLVAGASLAAGLLALALAQLGGESERPFIVHRGRPARPHVMVAELAGGWTGGILRPDGPAVEEKK